MDEYQNTTSYSFSISHGAAGRSLTLYTQPGVSVASSFEGLFEGPASCSNRYENIDIGAIKTDNVPSANLTIKANLKDACFTRVLVNYIP